MNENKELYQYGVILAAVICLNLLVWYFTGIGDILGLLKVPITIFKEKSEWPTWLVYGYGAIAAITVIALALNPFRKSTQYGNARLATEKDIRNMQLREDQGIILGIKGGKYIRTNQPLCVLAIAPPGSGKTAGIIIPSLLSCGHSCIVNDPKGELFEKTSLRRSAFSRILNFAPAEYESICWNPLSKEELPEDWNDIVTHVLRAASSVITSSSKEGEKDDYFETGARAIFMFFALYLIHKHGETSFPAVRSFALSEDSPQDLMLSILAEDDTPQRVLEYGRRYANMSDRQFDGVFDTFNTKMDMFSDPRVERNLSRSDFSIKELREENITIYLSVRSSDQSRMAPLVSMFFEFATLTLINKEPTKDEKWVVFFLDEFVRLKSMPEVVDMPAISRSYRVMAVFIVQTGPQLKALYGEIGLGKLQGTCAFHVIFSQNELTIAENYSKIIGKETRKRLSESKQLGKMSKSRSESEEGHELISAQKLMSLGGEVVILRQGKFNMPVICKPAMWFKDRAMKPLIGQVELNYDQGKESSAKNDVVESEAIEETTEDIIDE